jgi:MtrB/PioB family decaheme-associated outer membrane protein
MSYRRAAGFVLAGFVISLAGSGGAGAEPEIFGLKASGDVEVGGRVFIERPPEQDRAKFEEYRDLPESAFSPYLRLRGDSKDDFYTVEIFGENIGQDDQKFTLSSYGVGKFNFLFLWDQIPHTFCTNCRTLYVESPQATFNLPTPRPSPLDVWNSAPLIDEVGFQTNTAAVGIGLTPAPAWDIGLEGSAIFRSGDRPLGTAFGTPGNQAAEVAAPVEDTTYGAHFNLGFAGKGYQLQFGYDFSLYNNDIDALRVDNPCFGLPAALPAGCGAGSGNPPAPATGQGSLAPDNIAHTFTLGGGVNLPLNTRLTGSFSYSLRFQDQAFLPFTIAPTPGGDLAALAQAQANLPASLDGQVNILRFNLNATSRLTQDLTATGRFRVYDYDDTSPEIPFTAYVEDDRAVVSGAALPIRAELARRYPYTKYDAGGDLRYQLFQPLTLKVAFDWEQWIREADQVVVSPASVEPGGDSVLHVPREVFTTNQYTPKAMLDYTPLDWLLFRFGYAFSTRTGTEYLQASEEQLALLRKYDMADRDRNRWDFLADIMAMDNLTFTATFSYTTDDYGSSQFGLQDANNWAAGGDVTWKPFERLSLFAGYVHEEWDTQSRHKYRQAATELNNATFDWVSQTDDRYDTVRAGFNVVIIPQRLEGGANYNFSMGRTSMNASNPLTPVGTGSASAVAANFPEIETTLNQVNAFLRYWITKNFSAKVMYSWEQWQQSDFRFDGLLPFNFPNPNTGDTIFLGMDPQNYTAQWFTLSLGYHF